MSDLWITVPADDTRVVMPTSMDDKNIKIMFRDAETIESVIAQLESIKEMLGDSVNLFV